MYIFIYTYIHIRIHIHYIHIYCHFKRKTEPQAFFLNLFSVCSSYKRKFFICLFVDKETNGSYLCKWTERIKQSKRTCPYMSTGQSELFSTKLATTKNNKALYSV